MKFSIIAIVLAALVTTASSVAQDNQSSANLDWPQILGANRNGIIAETGRLGWDDEPVVVWEKDVGEGFAGPVISGEELILFHRPNGSRGKSLVVEKFNANSGASVWKRELETQFNGAMDGDSGPKATPVISDGFIYCHGPDGELACLKFDDGQIVWQLNARKQFKASSGYFGCGSTPIVIDGLVLLNVGGRDGASVVAFDALTGEVKWKAVKDEASYSSPIAVQHNGKSIAVFLTRTKFVGLDAASGEILFSNPFGKRGPTAVASMPVAFGSKIFANAAYRVGAMVVDLSKIKTPGEPIEADWSSNTAFASHYGTPIYRDEHIYGTSGREDFGNGSFRCIEAATGDLKWEQSSFPVAHTLSVGELLLVLDHKGQLGLIEPSPDQFKLLKTAKVFKGETRAVPAYSNGRLFFRSNAESKVGKLIAIDVKEK